MTKYPDPSSADTYKNRNNQDILVPTLPPAFCTSLLQSSLHSFCTFLLQSLLRRPIAQLQHRYTLSLPPPLLPLQVCPPTTSAFIPAKTEIPKTTPQEPQHCYTPPLPLPQLSESDFVHETYGEGRVCLFPAVFLPQFCPTQTWRVVAPIQPLAYGAR